VIVVDTSVAVAAALAWHESHGAARAALPRAKTPLLAQVAIETYSVLTRLPPPQRVPTPVARDYLAENFRLPSLALRPDGYSELLEIAVEQGLAGGAVYDAVVAATAKQVGATLLTLDRRALPTYRAFEVDHRLVA